MSRGHIAAALAAATLALGASGTAQANSFPLAGWWPMNEGSGQTIRDWSGKGNHGFLGRTASADANDPSWIRGVFFGSALKFGGDDFVSIPDSAALEPQKLTVSAWVRGASSPGRNKYIVAKGALGCERSAYGLYTSASEGVGFYVSDAETFYPSATYGPELWDGRWHNVVGTYDGTSVRLFVDGVRVAAAKPGPAAIDYALPVGNTQIGNYGDGTSPCFDNNLNLVGDVDGVQVWSTALPVDTIWSALRPVINLAR